MIKMMAYSSAFCACRYSFALRQLSGSDQAIQIAGARKLSNLHLDASLLDSEGRERSERAPEKHVQLPISVASPAGTCSRPPRRGSPSRACFRAAPRSADAAPRPCGAGAARAPARTPRPPGPSPRGTRRHRGGPGHGRRRTHLWETARRVDYRVDYRRTPLDT